MNMRKGTTMSEMEDIFNTAEYHTDLEGWMLQDDLHGFLFSADEDQDFPDIVVEDPHKQGTTLEQRRAYSRLKLDEDKVAEEASIEAARYIADIYSADFEDVHNSLHATYVYINRNTKENCAFITIEFETELYEDVAYGIVILNGKVLEAISLDELDYAMS